MKPKIISTAAVSWSFDNSNSKTGFINGRMDWTVKFEHLSCAKGGVVSLVSSTNELRPVNLPAHCHQLTNVPVWTKMNHLHHVLY